MYYVSFPKNIWKKIKEFEFQLLYPKEVQILFLNDIKLIINSNYFFLLDEILIPKFNKKLDFEYQYNYLKHNHYKYWKVFTDNFLRDFIKKHNDLFLLTNKIM